MKTFTTSQLRQLRTQPWVMRYNQLLAVVDTRARKVMYIEDYGPERGFFTEGWRALHYPLTSPLVEKSYREGNITVGILKEGKARLQLIPSFSPLGIQECKIEGKNVHLTFAGLGGAGVSASFSRGMADGVKKVTVLQEGGGTKLGVGRLTLPAKHMLLIGLDDTDTNEEGATYALAHNISVEISKKFGAYYAIHNSSQLFPYNPHKTKNCMSTVSGFIYDTAKQKEAIVKFFYNRVKRETFSQETGMAIFEGFVLPQKFREFAKSIKFRMLENQVELRKICKESGVKLYEVSGQRGLIGAVAALAFFDSPDFGAKLPTQLH